MSQNNTVRGTKRSRLFSRPSSKLGWWSLSLFIASLGLIMLNALVVMPITESRAGLSTLQGVFNGAGAAQSNRQDALWRHAGT